MTWVIGADVDASTSGLPESLALIECDPTSSELMVKPNGNAACDVGITANGLAPSKNSNKKE
jgi:hypothetical protein